MFKNRSGITLIALIITIIVLLILAGVTISLVVGDNGILSKSKEAKAGSIVAEEKEQVNLAYSAALTKTLGAAVTAEDLQAELDNSVGIGKTEVSVNDDETLNILFNETGHNYKMNGYTIEQEELLELHITNYNELLDFANRVNAGETFAKYIVYLDNDITVEDDDWVMIGTTGSRDDAPMYFEGIFEGNNHTIKELTFTSKDYMGLFCFNEGIIKNLKVEATINLESNNCTTGGICSKNYGNVLNCSVIITTDVKLNSVNFSSDFGGICGYNSGLIDGCKTVGNIKAKGRRINIGGITGSNYSILRNCRNEASITTSRIAGENSNTNSSGGIAGYNYEGEIIKCINIGELVLRNLYRWWYCW